VRTASGARLSGYRGTFFRTHEVAESRKRSGFELFTHTESGRARNVTIKDEPLRAKAVFLVIRKRRFFCRTCRKPFMEPVQGIGKGRRTTHRFQASVCRAAELYSDLKSVQRTH
jgi:transposase